MSPRQHIMEFDRWNTALAGSGSIKNMHRPLAIISEPRSSEAAPVDTQKNAPRANNDENLMQASRSSDSLPKTWVYCHGLRQVLEVQNDKPRNSVIDKLSAAQHHSFGTR
jgi:hypothetical protein